MLEIRIGFSIATVTRATFQRRHWRTSRAASAAALKLALETIIVQTKFQHFKAQGRSKKVRFLRNSSPRSGLDWLRCRTVWAAYLANQEVHNALNWYERAVNQTMERRR
jgi:hypothetical protein